MLTSKSSLHLVLAILVSMVLILKLSFEVNSLKEQVIGLRMYLVLVHEDLRGQIESVRIGTNTRILQQTVGKHASQDPK